MRSILAFLAVLLASSISFAQSFPPSPRVLVAVNPITNKVYVANEAANTVTVLDEAHDTTATIPVGSRPQFITVNPFTNRVFVNNGGEASISVIDGATDTNLTPTPLAVGSQGPMAVNTESNMVYIVRMTGLGTDEVTYFDGNNDTWYTIATESFQPTALAVNPKTDTLYVAHYGTGDVRVISAANTGDAHPATVSIPAWSHPFAIAANTGTNKIYVITEDSRGPIGIIDGATNTATWPAPAAGHASGPKALAVNPVTNRIYAAFAGEVVVIDGGNDSFTYVPVNTGSGAASIAINYFTNRIYVSNDGGDLTVIDGDTNATTPLTVPAGTISLGLNPMTNEIIAAGGATALVDGVTGSITPPPLLTTINPLASNRSGPGGTITMTASNGFANPLPIRGVFYQLDSLDGAWIAATGTGPYSATYSGLAPGSHTIHAFAAEGHLASTDTGPQNNPLVGGIASYTFTVGTVSTPTVSLGSSKNPSTIGESVTFTASVVGAAGGAAPTGTVSFMDGSSTLCTAVALASGSASCTSNALTVGSHTIAANYSGDSSYGAASASIPQTVNAPLPPAKSEITSPAPGSTLSGTTITFSWTAGSQVVERYLMVGTMAGGSDLYAGYQGNATSRTVSGIPQDGSTVFVRLMSYINGGWETADYSYATAGSGAPPPTPQKSTITSPADGSTLSSATVTFTWTAGSGVAERYLQVGTAMGGSDIYAGYQGSATSKAVSGIPQDGRIVYVRLMSYMGGAWQVADYTYSGGSGTPPPAPSPTPSAIISPTPGSTLAGSTATFTWDAGSGVTERYLMVGTTPGGSQVYAAYQGTASSRTVTGLPSNGSTVYVSLASWIEGNWQVNSYTYRAAGP